MAGVVSMGDYDNYPMGASGASEYFEQPDEQESAFELSAVERLAIAQAFQKAVGELTKTGVPTNLRGEVDAEMERRFEVMRTMGAAPKSFDIELLGRKVGTYSITTSEEKPSKVDETLVATDPDAYLKWAIEHGFVRVDDGAVKAHFFLSGEVPDGCEVRHVVTPAVEGGAITKTTLRIDKAKVANVLSEKQLADAGYMLLGGEM